MRRGTVILVALLGCETPVDVATSVAKTLSSGRVEDVRERIHPDYSDPLGDRTTLLRGLDDLIRGSGPLTLRVSELEAVRGPEGPTVIGKIEATLAGSPSWTFTGPFALELAGKNQIRSGLLGDLREIRALFAARRAALEANDAKAIGALIHPEYRDGTLDRAGAIARLESDIAGTPIRIEPLSYWVEVRGLDAHVDERYTLTLDEVPHASIARFTLRRSAGSWRIFAGLYASP